MAKQQTTYLVTQFEKFLKNFLKNIFDTTKLEIISSGNVYTIGACKGMAIQFSSNNSRNEYIIPFYVKDTDNPTYYYFGVSLEFPINIKTAEPNLVSLRFFTGERDDICIIFRAEFQKDSSQDHGQPHWHFHFIEEKEKTFNNFEQYELSTSESFDTSVRSTEIMDIHFCMAWNLKGYSTSLERNVLKWITDTISYVHSQLAYVHKRTN